ncbi:MAG TPA: serine/threonine-protein kinase, partial [Candidatus Acidoferrales bacterium]|nr:serine/threonine-protein kinase [Candidatus Acidoferrales bacterium]
MLALAPENEDAEHLLVAAERARPAGSDKPPPRSNRDAGSGQTAAAQEPTLPTSFPTSFAAGRYEVKRFLGEGGKKRVYLAHDTTLDRDVAFALIKTDGLDDTARERIAREAQAMGRLGAHPHIVTVFDLGEEAGQPYMVTELMGGGDVEGVIERAPDHKLPLERALAIAEQVCQGLEFAHAQQIVHRDLKPGNVWLTTHLSPGPFPAGEGETAVPSPRGGGLGRGQGGGGEVVAKIGDFGLAVAIDR